MYETAREDSLLKISVESFFLWARGALGTNGLRVSPVNVTIQTCSLLRNWSHLLKKLLIEILTFHEE